MASFLKWSGRGYFPNYEELKRQIVAHQSMAICLHDLQF